MNYFNESADPWVWFDSSTTHSSSFVSFVEVIPKHSLFLDDNGQGSADEVRLNRHLIVHAMTRGSVAVRAVMIFIRVFFLSAKYS